MAGVKVDGEVISADKVVIAMGPWSGDAVKWLPNVPSISGQKAHSILVRPTQPIGPECLFTQFQNSSGGLGACTAADWHPCQSYRRKEHSQSCEQL